MKDEAFEDFYRWIRRGALAVVSLTQPQADKIKEYVQSRVRDRPMIYNVRFEDQLINDLDIPDEEMEEEIKAEFDRQRDDAVTSVMYARKTLREQRGIT